MAAYVHRLALDASSLLQQNPEIWFHVWDAARRGITVAATVRPACLALNVILGNGLLKTAMNSSLLENTFFSGGGTGPYYLTDTSLILLTNILRSPIMDDERHYEAFCIKVLTWLNVRWTLRKWKPCTILLARLTSI